MPLILPKRCPRCASRATKQANGYYICPVCGWTDDPALILVPYPTVSEQTVRSQSGEDAPDPVTEQPD